MFHLKNTILTFWAKFAQKWYYHPPPPTPPPKKDEHHHRMQYIRVSLYVKLVCTYRVPKFFMSITMKFSY